MIRLFLFLSFTGFCLAAPDFTIEEVDKIKATLNQMTGIVEGSHKEILEMEDVLARAGTQLRKARLSENMLRKMASMKERLQDLRKLRSGFALSRQLREFCIALDDRLKIMEDNLSMIERIYFPTELAFESDAEAEDMPTFINPGDPRFEMDQDQERLARAIQRGGNLLALRQSHIANDGEFLGFVDQLDENLKADNKPNPATVPVLGHNSLDQFHRQLTEAQRKDTSFNWNEDESDKSFRQFYTDVENHQKAPSVNERVVTGFTKLDEPTSAVSRKTFAELMGKLDTDARAQEGKRQIAPQSGKPSSLKGFNDYMNDVRIDTHKPAPADFQEFTVQMAQGSNGGVQKYLSSLKDNRTFAQVMTTPEPSAPAVIRPLAPPPIAGSSVSFEEAFGPIASAPQPKPEEPRKPVIMQKLDNNQSLMPVTVQLLDEERQPYASTRLDFELILPEGLSGRILDAEEATPNNLAKVTNQSGEATINLLLDLKGRQVEVEKRVTPVGASNDRVKCELFVALAKSDQKQ